MLKNYLFLITLFIIAIAGVILWQSNWLGKQSNLTQSPQKSATLENDILSKIHVCFEKKVGQNNCYKEVAHDFLKNSNLEEALNILQKNQTQPEIFQSCHQMAHLLGREEYNLKKSVGESLTKCSPVCFAGCYHGVLEGYFIEKNLSASADNSLIAKEVSALCGKKEGYKNNELYNQCLHGLGHAVMFLAENELPRSLKLCDELQTQSDQEWCYSGAFMENSTSSTNKDHPSQYLRADDPMYPCTILDQKYLNMCYALQSFYFAEVSNYDWNKTIGLCHMVPIAYQATCFRSIGQNLVGFTQDLETIKKNCSLIVEDESEKACVQGVVLALSSKYNGDYSRMVKFCSIVDQKNKRICYDQLRLSMQDWFKNPQDLKNVCLTIPEEEYKAECTKAI